MTRKKTVIQKELFYSLPWRVIIYLLWEEKRE